MSIKITKTSKQAKLEKENLRKDSTCPECGYELNLSSYYYEGKFLREQTKVHYYICFKCGCEWEVRS